MKKLILTATLLALAETAPATTQGVYTSTDGSRIILFSHYPKRGVVISDFYISDHTGKPLTKNGILYQSSNPKKPVMGNAYTFGQSSPYYENQYMSDCLISATWKQGGVLDVSTAKSCSKPERTVYTGRYRYTPNVVFPQKYRGAWAADCRNTDPAEWLHIGKNGFTQSTDFPAATLVNTNMVDGNFVAAAAEISEGAGSRSFLIIRPEKGGLRVTGEHHGNHFSTIVRKCSNKSKVK